MLSDILVELDRLKSRVQEEITAISEGHLTAAEFDLEAEGARLRIEELENELSRARATEARLRAELEGDLSQATLVNLTEELGKERSINRELREQIKVLKGRLEQRGELISPEEAAGLVEELARLSDERTHQAAELARLEATIEELARAHERKVESLEQRARAAEEMAERPLPPPPQPTEAPASQRELQRLAFEDPVTGLPKFELGLRFLTQQLDRAARGQGTVSVAVVDVDQLRSLNLHLGYEAGSKILSQLCSRLQACLKPDDVIVRGQDDELWFVTAIPTKGPMGLKASGQRATAALAAFIESIKSAFEIGGHKMQITVGCGIVTSQGEESSAQVIERAVLALKASKREGRNGAAFYQPELERLKKKGTELLPQLQQSLQEEQFSLRFQPIYDLKTTQIWGIESLIRWNHPRRGLLLPAEFLDVACETGFMVQLGEWAMLETCRVARTVQLPTAFNVSAQELMQADFVRKFTRAIELAQARPEGLIVEISESDLAGDNDRLGAALKELRRWGVQVAIDDFTFDTLSMGRLRHWNVSYLKLGAPMVNAIDGARGRSLARTAIVGAESLGCKVIAEAISTPHQLELLLELGCQLGQGDHLCPAVLPAALEEKSSFRSAPPIR